MFKFMETNFALLAFLVAFLVFKPSISEFMMTTTCFGIAILILEVLNFLLLRIFNIEAIQKMMKSESNHSIRSNSNEGL